MSVANQSIVINYSPATTIQAVLTPVKQLLNTAFTQGVVYDDVVNNRFIAQTYTLGNTATEDELMTIVIGIKQNWLYMEVWETFLPPGSIQLSAPDSNDPQSPYNVTGMERMNIPTGVTNGMNVVYTTTFTVATTTPITGQFRLFNNYGSGGVIQIDGTNVGSSTTSSVFSLNSNLTLAAGTHTLTITMALQANYTGPFFVVGTILGPNNVLVVTTGSGWQSNSTVGTVSGGSVGAFNASNGANYTSGSLLYFGESGIIWASANQGYVWFNSKSQYGTQYTIMACGMQRYAWDTLDLYGGPGIVNKTKRYGMMMGSGIESPLVAGYNYYYRSLQYPYSYMIYTPGSQSSFDMVWPTGYDSPVYWPDDQYNKYPHDYMNGFPRDWATIDRQDPNQLELLTPPLGTWTGNNNINVNNVGSYANTGPTYYMSPGVLGVGLFTTNVTSESIGPNPITPAWIVLPPVAGGGSNTVVFPWSAPTAIAV
jgi:hypothetical protein